MDSCDLKSKSYAMKLVVEWIFKWRTVHCQINSERIRVTTITNFNKLYDSNRNLHDPRVDSLGIYRICLGMQTKSQLLGFESDK